MAEENYCKGNCIGIQETGANCNSSERCEHNWPPVYTNGNHAVQNTKNAAAFELCPQVVTLSKADQYKLRSCWMFVIVSDKESQLVTSLFFQLNRSCPLVSSTREHFSLSVSCTETLHLTATYSAPWNCCSYTAVCVISQQHTAPHGTAAATQLYMKLPFL